MAPQNDTYDMLDTSAAGGGRGKLIAALIALLLVAGGAAAYFLIDRDKGGSEVAGVSANGRTAPAPQNATAPTAASPAATTAQPTESPVATTAPGRAATGGGETGAGTAGGAGAGTRAGPAGVVHFDVNRTEVPAADAAQVDAFYARVKDAGGGTINVEGHADSTGPEAHNQWLARARAEEVAALLRRKGADKKHKINVSGFSSSRPLADNGTEDGRSKNRRVEVSYSGGN